MKKKYVISISYGNYLSGVGGTDKVIFEQNKILNKAGYDVVHLYPFCAFGHMLSWNVLLNGKEIGLYSTELVKRMIYDLSLKQIDLSGILIHHLKNININSLRELLSYCKNVKILFYIHDYYTICPFHGLTLSNGKFCGYGFPSDIKCKKCSFYDYNIILNLHIKSMFKENHIIFVAPSETAARVWGIHYKEYRDKIFIMEHQIFRIQKSNPTDIIEDNSPIKVAFVGYQSNLKGWKQFVEASQNASNAQKNERFYQFGFGGERYSFIKQITVDYKKKFNKMEDMLVKEGIHCAVLYSLCPETYSYTYYEAFSANCFIITNPMSGNIYSQTLKNQNGVSVSNLSEFFLDEKALRMMINRYRTVSHSIPFQLVFNNKFLSLLNDSNSHFEYIYKKVDYSSVLNLIRKIRKKIKEVIN